MAKNVPPYFIVFGSPVRIVRSCLPKEISLKLEKSNWRLGEAIEAVTANWEDLDGAKNK